MSKIGHQSVCRDFPGLLVMCVRESRIHVELEDLNAEAVRLAERIRKNFEELGI